MRVLALGFAAAALLIASEASAQNCGPAQQPRTGVGRCIIAKGVAKWGYNTSQGRNSCEWHTRNKKVYKACQAEAAAGKW